MRIRFIVLVCLVALPRMAASRDLETEGICAYGAGRFGEAAVDLTRALREASHPEVAERAYFAGRALRELGLRALAEPLIARAADVDAASWRRLARRELARLAFERGDEPALLALLEQNGPPADAEIRYLAGIASARQRRWSQAIDLLADIPPAAEIYPYARYVRAQSSAAAGDLVGALDDLGEVARHALPPAVWSDVRLEPRELLEPVDGEADSLRVAFAPAADGVSLADRAEVLRGKILYVEGRKLEARSAFAAVRGAGAIALESSRGLLLTGDERSPAARAERTRPVQSAVLRVAEAFAAEEREDFAAALHARSALRDMVRKRLEALERLRSRPSIRSRLVADLGVFASSAARSRAEQRWPEEEVAARLSCSFGPLDPASASAFEPSDGLFYELWERLRGDPRFGDFVDLAGVERTLESDLRLARLPRARPLWPPWGPGGDDPLDGALLVLRLTNLELRLDDALRAAGAIGAAQSGARRRRAIEQAVDLLSELSLPTPDEASRDERRATDTVIEAFGRGLGLSGGAVLPARLPASRSHATIGALFARIEARSAEIAAEIARRLLGSVDAEERAQAAFFERIEADNLRSLSRLYVRIGTAAAVSAP